VQVVTFGDDTILNKPVAEWPLVQCLLSWHSEGFPLKKAQDYVALRKPFCVNDVLMQVPHAWPQPFQLHTLHARSDNSMQASHECLDREK
jgi:hypothetical protein